VSGIPRRVIRRIELVVGMIWVEEAHHVPNRSIPRDWPSCRPEPRCVPGECLEEVDRAARAHAWPLNVPFGTFSLLAMPVVPELRITNHGVFGVRQRQFVTQ
jgi:Adenine deaminase C-terminal domain